MIEVFRTNVQDVCQAEQVVRRLVLHFPETRINFDLQDCDHILRVEGREFCADTIIQLVEAEGFLCSVLD